MHTVADNAADRAAAGSENSPLTRFQKMLLARLAHRAWLAQGSPAPSEAAWRRQQSLRTTGVRISQARQKDYAPLRACFLDSIRQYTQAFKTLIKAEENKARIARYKLAQACTERGLDISYPTAICRRQFKCSLDEATAKQIWCLVFTTRNRRPLHPSH